MSPKTGRPKINNPIAESLSVRIDKETKESFMKFCKENALSQGEAIRQAIQLLLESKK